jgi:hypothetical protein
LLNNESLFIINLSGEMKIYDALFVVDVQKMKTLFISRSRGRQAFPLFRLLYINVLVFSLQCNNL